MWAFLQAAFALILSWATDLLTWLRKPGSVLKSCCAVLAVICFFAALSSYRQGQRVIVVTQQFTQCEADRKAEADAAVLKRAELESNVADKDAALTAIAERLQAEADNLAKLQARNLALRAETEAATAEAARSAQAFKQQYDQRPVECTAALKAMAQACPTLGGY
jgi:Tfp pilus assembly protein FimV